MHENQHLAMIITAAGAIASVVIAVGESSLFWYVVAAIFTAISVCTLLASVFQWFDNLVERLLLVCYSITRTGDGHASKRYNRHAYTEYKEEQPCTVDEIGIIKALVDDATTSYSQQGLGANTEIDSFVDDRPVLEPVIQSDTSKNSTLAERMYAELKAMEIFQDRSEKLMAR